MMAFAPGNLFNETYTNTTAQASFPGNKTVIGPIKALFPSTAKFLVMVGGWGDSGGLKAVVGGDSATQMQWAGHLMDFMNTYGYDGVG
jgi:GH18 family chitinase